MEDETDYLDEYLEEDEDDSQKIYLQLKQITQDNVNQISIDYTQQ